MTIVRSISQRIFTLTCIFAVLVTFAPLRTVVADTDCFSTHTSTGEAFFIEICISNHGNLVMWSTSSNEHIRVGLTAEGYLLCSNDGSTLHGYDAGYVESGFGAPVISQPNGPNTFPFIVTRDTTDGAFRLKVKFFGELNQREVLVIMKVKNLSLFSMNNVILLRYFDGDMNGTPGNDVYRITSVSSYGVENNTPTHALALSAIKGGVTHVAGGLRLFTDWNPADCNQPSVSSGPNDYIGLVRHNLGTIGSGEFKKIKVLYRGL